MQFKLGLVLVLILSMFIFELRSQNKESLGSGLGQKSRNGSTQPSKIKPADISECPVKVPIKPDGYELITPIATPNAKANILRSTNTLRFDKVELNNIRLNIPAFKQFKNNKTEFTLEGEQQFNLLKIKIKNFLNALAPNKTIQLFITGSASQIPTSYDPSKPNNNLKLDGSSIAGQTSVENNRLLAKARADELAKKLKSEFPVLNIVTPKLEDIKLGELKWSLEHQKELNRLTYKKDKVGIEKLFEPFQKDQWVKVESNEIVSKTIQPEAAKMYMVSTTPPLKTKLEGKDQSVKTIFIVSKATFDKVGQTKTFGTIGERDRFLKRFNLKIFHLDKDSVSRWYLLAGKPEIEAFNIPDYNLKVEKLYKLGINDIFDQKLIQQAIEKELNEMYQ